MKLKRHLYCAKKIKKIQERLNVIDSFVGLKSKQIDYILHTNKIVDQLKCELDYDFHEIIDDKQFRKLGHIYYGGRNEKDNS